MRRAAAALAAIVVCLALAGPASADVRYATLGDISAALTFTQHDGYIGAVQLKVTKSGTTLWSGDLTTREGRPGAPATPLVHDFAGAQLNVVDLDGDGTGEVVVDLAERGSYCCSHSVIVGPRAGGAWKPLALDWGSYGDAAAVSPVKVGNVLVARDDRLDERYTPHVLSVAPVRIWRYADGAVKDVTRQQPLIVQKDLADLLAERKQLLARKDHATIDIRGLLTAITGDRLLLGQRTQAIAALNADVAAGNVRVSSGQGPTGKKFPPALLKLLAHLGY